MKAISMHLFADNSKKFTDPRFLQVTHLGLEEQLKRILYKLQYGKNMPKTWGQSKDGMSLSREALLWDPRHSETKSLLTYICLSGPSCPGLRHKFLPNMNSHTKNLDRGGNENKPQRILKVWHNCAQSLLHYPLPNAPSSTLMRRVRHGGCL